MPRLFPLFVLAVLPALAEERVEFRTGPFQVWTNAGNDRARVTLNHLEQVRYIVGTALGNSELVPRWPVRVVLMRKAVPVAPVLARDAYIAALAPGSPPASWVGALVRIFIDDGARRMPAEIEDGLVRFYSTMQVEGTRVTLGVPVAPGERNAAWAKVQLLQTSPEYSGKLRVLLYNLQQSADPAPAYRNAFGKTPAEIEKEAAAHLASGRFQTVMGNSKPVSPARDFRPSYEPPPAATALADLKLVQHAPDARAAYEALLKTAPAVAHEGLGLIALEAGGKDDARRELQAAVDAGSKSARAHFELARLEESEAKRRAELDEAAKLNPAWPAPHAFRAEHETDPLRKLQALQAAAKLAPRDGALQRQLAEQYMAVNKYGDASRAWAAAEQAATSDTERAAMRDARRAIEDKRLEWQEAERKRREEERERDIRAVREKALADVRAAEARANRAAPPAPADRNVVPMFEGPAPQGRVRGRITRVDCIAPMAKLTVQTETVSVVLLAREPAKVVVFGDEKPKFDCGPQNPPRLAVVEYFPKEDKRTGTAGEVATIEYESAPKPSADAPPLPPERKKLPRP